MPEFKEKGRRLAFCGSIRVKTSGPRIIENFLDMAHFPFVHNGILGDKSCTEVSPYKVELREECNELWATECVLIQPQATADAEESTKVDYRFRVAEPFSSVLYKSSSLKQGVFDLIGIFVQPLEETFSEVHCFMLVYDDTSSDHFLVQWQQSIFMQDRNILENQIPLRLPLWPGSELPVGNGLGCRVYHTGL